MSYKGILRAGLGRISSALLCLGLLGGTLSAPASAADKLEILSTPSVGLDAIWMAEARGFFKEENLDVQVRLFPSGTTAFQTFNAGAGDIIFSGDLPALQYWQKGGPYRVIAPAQRDFGSYIAVVKNDIKTPQDLVGKTIATRVGSTGSWFISEYLTKNGIDEKSVSVRNLDPPQMPVALCQGDIDGFFIWLPAPTKALEICGDKVHILTNAEGYVRGYNIGGARKEVLDDPAGADKVTRFLKAVRKGMDVAANEEEETVAYLIKKFGYTEQEVKMFRSVMERVFKMDQTFFDDFCSENRWQQRAGLWNEPSDLGKWVWPDGLKAIDPTLVVDAPPPC